MARPWTPPAGCGISTGEKFQVFAINCAHLGCPVRWFPQSGLIHVPCHGGAYYRDGSRASGPPERGLFEYPYKVENGTCHDSGRSAAHAGDPSQVYASREKPPCAIMIGKIGEWFDHRLQLAAPIREAAGTSRAARTRRAGSTSSAARRSPSSFCNLVTGILLALIYVPSAAKHGAVCRP